MPQPDFPDNATLAAGRDFAGRFTLRRELGRGGMGVVWLAHDRSLDREVALKFLPELFAHDEAAVDDLKRETRRALALTHPHIVRIHDFVHTGGLAAVAMEYAPGPSLSALRKARPAGFFEPADLQAWVAQLCDALDYAHLQARIVHRDLKPANLLTDESGGLKITDFGIAATLNDSATRVSRVIGSSGTPTHMSPQQMLGVVPAPSDDIYAAGATLYELLTGKPPFYSGDLVRQVQESIPPTIAARRAELGVKSAACAIPEAWERTVAACLAKDPGLRPATAAALLAGLRGARGARPAQRRQNRLFLAGAMTAAALIGASVLILTRSVKDAPPAVSPTETKPADIPPSPVVATTADSVQPSAKWVDDWIHRIQQTTPENRSAQSLAVSKLVADSRTPREIAERIQTAWSEAEKRLDLLAAREAAIAAHPWTRLLDDYRTNPRSWWKLSAVAEDPDVQKAEADIARASGSSPAGTIPPQLYMNRAYAAWNRILSLRKNYADAFTEQPSLPEKQHSEETSPPSYAPEERAWLSQQSGAISSTPPVLGDEFKNSQSMRFVPVGGRLLAVAQTETPVASYLAFVKDTGRKQPAGESDSSLPATGVSWLDARAFCDWLTAKERASGTIGGNQRYRLPTDEEWSWIAGLPPESGSSPRAKNGAMADHYPVAGNSPYELPSDNDRLITDARLAAPPSAPKWHEGNYGFNSPHTPASPAPVASFSPTHVPVTLKKRFKIHDLGGNVWEWCADMLDPADSGLGRVIRGGAYSVTKPGEALTSIRRSAPENIEAPDIGFRCVFEYASAESAPPEITEQRTELEQERIARFAVLNQQRAKTNGSAATPVATQLHRNSLGMEFMVARQAVKDPAFNQFNLVIGSGLMMSRYETRASEFALFAKAKGLAWKQEGDGNLPAVNVSWRQANDFCSWLNEQERTAGRLRLNQRYRLPTAGEWMLAGWTFRAVDLFFAKEKFPWDNSNWPPSAFKGNYALSGARSDPFDGPAPVGSFEPLNGVFDLGGNVWEWTSDDYQAGQNSAGKALCGGSFLSTDREELLITARRSGGPANAGARDIGFRCVLEP